MELTIEQALSRAIAAHKGSKYEEAERLYRAILRSEPAHPDANHNLGLLAVAGNKADVALPLFKTALEANPKIEQFWLSYIDALIKGQQFENARQVFEQAKTQGVAAQKLKILEAQLPPTEQVGAPELDVQHKSLPFSQKRKKLAEQKKRKKAAKKNSNANSPSEQQLSRLLEYYQNGRFNEAEKLADLLTQEFPKHQFAWKVLGAVLGVTGRYIDALKAHEKAVNISPKDAQAHSNLGNTLKELGRSDEAEASYKKAIEINPRYTEAHYNLGVTLKELGRVDEALASYSQAIALKPDLTKAHYNLGVALQELGRSEEAEASYNQAIALEPNHAEAHNNLGVLLQELGRPKAAEACYNQAIALKPDYAEAHYNFGNALKGLGRTNEALACYNQAIALKPDYAEAHNNFGNALRDLGRVDEALASYDQATELKPGFAEAHNNLGNMLQDLGRVDEALTSYKKAIDLKPYYAEAHRHLSSAKKFDAKDEQYSKMLELHLDKNISEDQRCHINFALAKACEDLGDFEQAFAHYGEGNMLRKKLLNYEINQDVELFSKIKSNYPRIERVSLASEKALKDLMPIFIVGMPRSGTTLVEQIISSHSQVTGAGELPFAAQFGATVASGLSEANNTSLLDFRHNYLNKLQNVSNGNLIVTDKMPQNFLYIGLIAAAFPEAKIIHVKRNPAAVCWANYKQYFGSPKIGFCYAIDDVIKYHKLYENLMEFWTKKLSKRIYNLDYELLTINQEIETQQLIEYLGLDWQDNCLSPQNNTRRVATASNLQVRQKVYQGSSEQWKKYAPFLQGAFDELIKL